MNNVKNFIEHLSEKPWSMYTKADYSIEQWHASCLIHQHEGPPTSKGQCKVPIKTPGGAVNKNGVFSAAAALAGARGGVQASPEQKASAARILVRYYRQMDKEPPPSLMKHSEAGDFLVHYGKKGMRWGVRNKRTIKRRSRKETRVRKARQQMLDRRRQISDNDLKTFVERLNNEKKLKTLINEDLKPGRTVTKKILSTTGQKIITTAAAGAAVVAVQYAVQRKLTPKFDDEGKKIKIKLDPKETADIIARGKKKNK